MRCEDIGLAFVETSPDGNETVAQPVNCGSKPDHSQKDNKVEPPRERNLDKKIKF